jgi:hypothetical protein
MSPTLAMQAWNEDCARSWRPATVIAPPWRGEHASVLSPPGWLVSGVLDTTPCHERFRSTALAEDLASEDVLDKPPYSYSHKSANSSRTPKFLGAQMSVVLIRSR